MDEHQGIYERPLAQMAQIFISAFCGPHTEHSKSRHIASELLPPVIQTKYGHPAAMDSMILPSPDQEGGSIRTFAGRSHQKLKELFEQSDCADAVEYDTFGAAQFCPSTTLQAGRPSHFKEDTVS